MLHSGHSNFIESLEDNIVVLLDDGNHTEPTYENIIDAYKTIISQSKKGDCIFLHYSGELLFLFAQLEH